MTQEDKNLLLKDLCNRLPYGVMIGHGGNLSKLDTIFMCDSISVSSTSIDKKLSYNLDLDEVKPYLYPISSMSKEHKKYIRNNFAMGATHELFDFLDRNNYDYRDLIPNGLAEDATGKNIY